MILVLSFLIPLFATLTFAGGYQGCQERVHLFQAYEIDGLLQPSSDRILRFKCRNWNTDAKICTNGDYTECRGSRQDNRCTFDELMDHMEKPRQRPWRAGVYQDNGRIDLQQTALNCLARYKEMNKRVQNFAPYQAMKLSNVHEFNDYLRKLGDRVNFVYSRQVDSSHNELFTDFDDTRDKINIARAGDHGSFLLEAASDSVGKVYTQDLGRNPSTGDAWITADWAKTAAMARASGDTDVQRRMRTFFNEFYGTPGDARKHFMVFKSYKYMSQKAITCGRRGMQKI